MEKHKHPVEAEETKHFSERAFKDLEEYHWPGNIRELKNFIERVNIMVDAMVISRNAVKTYLGKTQLADSSLGKYESMKLNAAKDEFEREFIEKKLKDHKHSISKTAQVLGIYQQPPRKDKKTRDQARAIG